MSLRKGIGFLNAKGGCGKTSILINVAGVLANSGYRVLVVNLDKQSNLARNLGYTGDPGDDEGIGLVEALLEGSELKVPLKDVRPNLDVIPGGPALEILEYALAQGIYKLEDHSQGRLREIGVQGVLEEMNARSDQALLFEHLEPIAGDYDLVFVDGPPSGGQLSMLALGSVSSVVIPVNPDFGTIDGLARQAREIQRSRQKGYDELDILGIALFQVPASAKVMDRELRAYLEAILGDIAPVFERAIRLLPTAGWHQRRDGELSYEYKAASAKAQAERFISLKATAGTKTTTSKPSTAAEALAEDYKALTTEILAALTSSKAAQAARAVAESVA